MARYDKYDPKVGGFRAALAADFSDATKLGAVIPVGLDVDGHVVLGAGTSGLVGVLILTKKRYAGDVVDVMTAGEIADFDEAGQDSSGNPVLLSPAAAAGKVYYGSAAGAVTATATGLSLRIGHTVEATRLVVRVQQVVAA